MLGNIPARDQTLEVSPIILEPLEHRAWCLGPHLKGDSFLGRPASEPHVVSKRKARH